MTDLAEFRAGTRAWLEANCPPGARGPGLIPTGSTKVEITDRDTRVWLDRMIEKGWTAPDWPKEYGGGGLNKLEYSILAEEMKRIEARPALGGFGVMMIGPTILEFGTEQQKRTHIPRITRAEVAWCQGYSEPGAGSDLASLSTRAEDRGDHFVINGQKVWTSGAHLADWMFILVRTDPNAPKHQGISFLLLPMDQPGITVRPIRMINGEAPFNATFFDNAVAAKDDLIGELNKGWTVGKRLLQHERSGMGELMMGSTGGVVEERLVDEARSALGHDGGRIADPVWRSRVAAHEMNRHAYRLAQRRAVEESEGGTPGPVSSIFKLYGSELQQDFYDLTTRMRGTRGFSTDLQTATAEEREMTSLWLHYRAVTIYSGSNEIQRNIIAKRVLGLPD
ncbi:MAG: acyl-CoA dehydrogenase family protein [Gammaproteobacteria bacterium]|nr:acyl-CoA dehydrogenase family protein [Gammaproteobacteria bacterium]MDE0366119.1 acyl-CoA dehydrogenase family protein [Gammaproteobacteria bacterium]